MFLILCAFKCSLSLTKGEVWEKLRLNSKSYRKHVHGSNLLLAAHKAFENKISIIFNKFLIIRFLLRRYFFPYPLQKSFRQATTWKINFGKANMEVDHTLGGYQVRKHDIWKQHSFFASCQRTTSISGQTSDKNHKWPINALWKY